LGGRDGIGESTPAPSPLAPLPRGRGEQEISEFVDAQRGLILSEFVDAQGALILSPLPPRETG